LSISQDDNVPVIVTVLSVEIEGIVKHKFPKNQHCKKQCEQVLKMMSGVELQRNSLKIHQEEEEEKDNDFYIGEEDRPLSGISVNIICPKNEE
jgi:hypothetical protein